MPTGAEPAVEGNLDSEGVGDVLSVWRPKLEAFYQALLDKGWDGLNSRSRPSLRSRSVDSGLLAEIGRSAGRDVGKRVLASQAGIQTMAP